MHPPFAGRMASQRQVKGYRGSSPTTRMTLRSASSRERVEDSRSIYSYPRSPSPPSATNRDGSQESDSDESDDSVYEGMTSIIDPSDLPVPIERPPRRRTTVTAMPETRRSDTFCSGGHVTRTENLCRTPRSSHGRDSPQFQQRKQEAMADEIKRRIIEQPMEERPLPAANEADTERLGYELKVRLASRSPVLRCHESTSSGRLHFYETSPSRREIPIYDIDEEGDPHLLCSVSVNATKT